MCVWWSHVFFLIGNKTFIEKIEHHKNVHDGDHSKQETDTI